MSDSVSKYFEMVEAGEIEDTLNVTPAPNFPSENDRKLAYRILVEFPKEAILEAARIVKHG